MKNLCTQIDLYANKAISKESTCNYLEYKNNTEKDNCEYRCIFHKPLQLKSIVNELFYGLNLWISN